MGTADRNTGERMEIQINQKTKAQVAAENPPISIITLNENGLTSSAAGTE